MPELLDEDKNPFIFDSKEPKADFEEYVLSQNRYSSLKIVNPDEADELLEKAEEAALHRRETIKELSHNEEEESD